MYVEKQLHCYLRGATALCLVNTCAIKLCRSVFSYNFRGIVHYWFLYDRDLHHVRVNSTLKDFDRSNM